MRGGESIEAQIQKARRGSVAGANDAQLQRTVGQYIERNLGQTLRDFALLKEKVEILTGERGRAEDAAVRRGNLKLLGQSAMKSEKVATAPTAEQFNALVDDVHSIDQQLSAIAELLARQAR